MSVDVKDSEVYRDLVEVARAADRLLDAQEGPAKDAGDRHAEALQALREAVEKPTVAAALG